MKKQLSLWIIIIIAIFFINVIHAQTNSHRIFPNETFSELTNKTPSYTLITIPATITTDRDKTVNVSIFISGLGNITNNKIRVFFPKNLLDSNDPGIIGGTIGCRTYYPINGTNETYPEFNDTNWTISENVFSLTPCNFMHDNKTNFTKTIASHEYIAPIIMSEQINDGKPPIYLIMNVNKDAIPGDHDIELVFTYTDGIKWYQDVKKITIHVNNPVEQNRTWLLIILAILAVPWITDYTKEKYKQLLSSRYGLLVQIIRVGLITYVVYLAYNSL